MPTTEPITVRDFLRNFAVIVQGTTTKRYVIMRHGKPIGVFTPWEMQKAESKKSKSNQLERLAWLDELE